MERHIYRNPDTDKYAVVLADNQSDGFTEAASYLGLNNITQLEHIEKSHSPQKNTLK